MVDLSLFVHVTLLGCLLFVLDYVVLLSIGGLVFLSLFWCIILCCYLLVFLLDGRQRTVLASVLFVLQKSPFMFEGWTVSHCASCSCMVGGIILSTAPYSYIVMFILNYWCISVYSRTRIVSQFWSRIAVCLSVFSLMHTILGPILTAISSFEWSDGWWKELPSTVACESAFLYLF